MNPNISGPVQEFHISSAEFFNNIIIIIIIII